MDPKDASTNPEAELESFRQKWREEVTARTKGKTPVADSSTKTAASPSRPRPSKNKSLDATTSSHVRQPSEDLDEVTPYAYQDLGEKQHGRWLNETAAETSAAHAGTQEPRTALEHYERAVEKEGEGRLGDSVSLYRKAFKVSSLTSTI